MKTGWFGIAVLGAGLALASSDIGWAGWQAGVRLATDSNVTRTVDGGTADQYLWGSLSFRGGGTGQERLDWAYTAAVEGALYAEVDEFSYAGVSFSPEALYHLSPSWTASAAPFVFVKGANDPDQSALAFGLRLALAQRLSEQFYAGEHYVYTNSRARDAEFSYSEHTVGAFLGASWTPRLWTELGYDFAHGDSFRTVETEGASDTPTHGGMGGMGDHRERAFGFDLVRENVDNHFLSATAGWNLSTALTPYIGYTYRVTRGDLGTATSHIGYLGATYQF
jgi:hypothetical protein